MPCSPVRICIPLPLPVENFPQPEIGAVCPFSGKETKDASKELRIMPYYALYCSKKQCLNLLGNFGGFIQRFLKSFDIDRKNFLFANTLKGATGSAIMFSLLQTAIENGLDPYRYLTWLLRTAKDANLTDTQAVQNLLPWNVPAECRVK